MFKQLLLVSLFSLIFNATIAMEEIPATGKNVLDPINMAMLTRKAGFKDLQSQLGSIILHNRNIKDYIIKRIEIPSKVLCRDFEHVNSRHLHPMFFAQWLSNNSIVTRNSNKITIYDSTNGKLLTEKLYEHITLLSPDSKYRATYSESAIEILDANTHEHIKTLSCPGLICGHFSWLPNSKQIAISYLDGSLRIWDLYSDSCKKLNNNNFIRKFSCSPNGKYLANLLNQDIEIWDINTNTCTFTFQNDNFIGGFYNIDVAPILSWSPDSKNLAVVDINNYEVQIWNIATHQCIRRLDHNDPVQAIAWNPEGSYIITCSETFNSPGIIKMWHAETGQYIKTIAPFNKSSFSCISWNPDGKKFLIATENQTIKIFDMESFEQIIDYLDNTIPLKEALLLLAIDKSMSLGEDYELDAESMKVFESLPEAIQDALKRAVRKHSWLHYHLSSIIKLKTII